MAADHADLHVAALNERLFLDDDDKDITFELSDGLERAHKAVLNAASDVFKTMLKQDMSEKASGVVKLPDVSRQVMRVFLRLLYTGRVDSSDWAGAEKAPGDEQFVLRQTNVQTRGQCLTSSGESEYPAGAHWSVYFSVALLDGGGAEDFEFVAHAEDWEGIALGVAPRGWSLGELKRGADAFTCEIDDGLLECGMCPSEMLEVPAGARITVKRQGCTLVYAVNGGDLVASAVQIRANFDYAPLLTFWRAGSTAEIVSITASSRQCPLDVLVGTTLLAKKYMVAKVLDMCTLVLRERLAAAKVHRDVGAFEEILLAAISGDLISVRMAALQAAKEGFEELRTKHSDGSLHPAVSQDLRDVLPPPPPLPAAKRQKTTAHLS